MSRFVVDVPAESDAELRAAGLDPEQIVRESVLEGIADALAPVRTGTTREIGTELSPALPSATPRPRTRPVPSTLDAVGVPSTATTGKIAVPVVRAEELEDTSLE